MWLGAAAVATIIDPGFSDEVRADTRRLFPETEFLVPSISQTIGTLTYSLGEDPAQQTVGEGRDSSNAPVETPE
jgi:hypothetical protein